MIGLAWLNLHDYSNNLRSNSPSFLGELASSKSQSFYPVNELPFYDFLRDRESWNMDIMA